MSVGDLYFIDNLNYTIKEQLVEFSKEALYVNIVTEKFELEGLKVILDNYDDKNGILNIILDGCKYTKGKSNIETNIQENFKKKFLRDFNSIVPNIDAWNVSQKIFKLLKLKKLNVFLYTKFNLHSNVFFFAKPLFNMYSWNILYGSSCLTSNSMTRNIESSSTKEAVLTEKPQIDWFENIKKDSIDVTDTFLDILENNTWLRNDIYPYMASMKLAYEFLREELDTTENTFNIKNKEIKLFQYQLDAVVSAKKILEKYNGVFISDVVGLGKSYIGTMLISQLDPDKTLVISPPKLINKPWNEMIKTKFKMRKVDIESVAKIANAEEYIDDIEYIVIDEAHGFRNKSTNKYRTLKKICKNKKMIFITATPYNNRLDDIVNLIELFWNDTSFENSGISLMDIKNNQSLNWLYKNVLSNILIRRTREDLKNYYTSDLKTQGIVFPEVHQPESLEYEISDKYAQYYYDTLNFIQNEFTYSSYMSLSEYYLSDAVLDAFSPLDRKYILKVRNSQRKMTGLMKCLLFKRLESSKHSFETTISVIRASINEKIKSIKNNGYIIFEKSNDYDEFVENISNIDNENDSDNDTDTDNLFNDNFVKNTTKTDNYIKIPVSIYDKLYADLEKDEYNLDMLQRK